LHLGRLPEAEATINRALEKDPQSADCLATAIVVATLSGKDSEAYLRYLVSCAAINFSAMKGKDHKLLHDLEEKSRHFEEHAAQYAPSVPA